MISYQRIQQRLIPRLNHQSNNLMMITRMIISDIKHQGNPMTISSSMLFDHQHYKPIESNGRQQQYDMKYETIKLNSMIDSHTNLASSSCLHLIDYLNQQVFTIDDDG